MTTEQLDEEKRIEERDDTIDEFIDVVEETKQHQHPIVENAVSGYVEKPEKRDGSIYITVDVPAYDEEVKTEVADVDGSLNTSSFLYGLLDEFDDISKLPTKNPIPLNQSGSDSFKLVGSDADSEEEDTSESGLTIDISDSNENEDKYPYAALALLLTVLVLAVIEFLLNVQAGLIVFEMYS